MSASFYKCKLIRLGLYGVYFTLMQGGKIFYEIEDVLLVMVEFVLFVLIGVF